MTSSKKAPRIAGQQHSARTARFIRRNMKRNFNSFIYELSEPVIYGNNLRSNYVIILCETNPRLGPITRILPSDLNGNELDETSLPGSIIGKWDHEGALRKARYEPLDVITLTYAEFIEQFKPIRNMVRDDDDPKYYTSESELDFVRLYANDPKAGISVWTHTISLGNIPECICDGYGEQHVLGYFLTSKAPETDKQYFVQEDEIEEELTCNCVNDAVHTVPTVSGDDVKICDTCYDAYIIGLNRGMNMIVELPESIKRSRLAEMLVKIKHDKKSMQSFFGRSAPVNKDYIEGFLAGAQSVLWPSRRAVAKFARGIMLVKNEDTLAHPAKKQ
jgi:hypothetical protein